MKFKGTIVGAIFGITLTACSSGREGPEPSSTPFPAEKVGESSEANSNEVNPIDNSECGIVFEKSAVDAYQNASAQNSRYLVSNPGGNWRCSSTRLINGVAIGNAISGYDTLRVTLGLKAIGRIESPSPEVGSTNSMCLRISPVSFTNEEKAELAALLKATKKFDATRSFQMVEFKPKYALIPGVPRFDAKSGKRFENGNETPIVTVFAGDHHVDKQEEFLKEFEAGKTPLVLFSQVVNDDGFQISEIYSEASLQKNSIKQISLYLGSETLWNRIPIEKGGESFLRTDIISLLSNTLERKPKPASEIRNALSPIVEFSENYWRNNRQDRSNAYALLEYLRFLAKTEPADDIKLYADLAIRLKPFIQDASLKLLDEVFFLIDQKPYTPEQEKAVFEFANAINNSGLDDPWYRSKKLLEMYKFDSARVAVTLQFFKWLIDSNHFSPNDAMKKTLLFVGEYGADSAQLGQFQSLVTWFSSAAGPSLQSSSAFEQSEDLMFNKKLKFERIEQFKSTFTWARSAQGPSLSSYNALEKAEEYLLTRKLANEKIKLIQDTFEWARSAQGPSLSSYYALEKAEEYVFTRALSSESVKAIRDTFTWTRSAQGPSLSSYYALEKAEEYVLDRKLSLVSVILIQETFEWARSAQGPSLSSYYALEKAEEYVISRKLSPEKVNLIKEVFTWARSAQGPSLSSYNALEKAEEYILTTKLSGDQTKLIRDSFEWLRSSGGPSLSSYNALDEGEYLVLKKRMTDKAFVRLKELFSNYRRTMGSDSAYSKAKSEAL